MKLNWNKCYRKYFIVIAMISAAFMTQGETPDKIILAGTEGLKNSVYGDWLEMIFSEAFGRLGYQLQYDDYPAARASVLSDSGDIDGEISRVYEYQDFHPDLIRLEEILYTTYFVAYATVPGIILDGWNSLKGSNYFVEYRKGVSLCGEQLPLVVGPEHLSVNIFADQGIKKLLLKRIDLYVDAEFIILDNIKKLHREGHDISPLYCAGIMQEIDIYAYLHKKRADLVPKIVKVLRDMKREGLFDSYFSEASERW